MSPPRRFAPPRFCVTAVAMLAASALLYAPTGEQVAAGAATFARDGALTTITASDGAIINYTGFDILAHETVSFVQPGETARVLNRVNSPDPTSILGTLRANGIVYLVNPAGLYFGQDAFLDVGGLFAAAGTISNQEFLAYSNHFSNLSGPVVNAGVLHALDDIALAGRSIANRGSILSRRGAVALLAGDDVLVGEAGQHVFVNVGSASSVAAGTGVENTGRIEAAGAGGSATLAVGDLYSLAISQSGEILGPRVRLEAGAGRAEVSGSIDATNATGPGGAVAVLGNQVHLKGTAAIDASGSTGGGTVLIGGDVHGENAAVANATRTAVAQGATITADARASGDGGKVVVWSDDATSFWGNIYARGAGTGRGGFAEVSGKNSLAFNGGVDLTSPAGSAGTLLLDPAILNIVASGATNDAELADGSILFADGGAATFNVSSGAVSIALNTQDVLLQATNAINVTSEIFADPVSPDNSLTLAAPTISLRASVTTNGGQTYQGGVLVGDANNPFAQFFLSSRSGSDITFAPIGAPGPVTPSTVNSTPGANAGLTVFTTGTATFAGPVGTVTPLESLTISGGGATQINGGSVTTNGTQIYSGAVAMGGDTALTAFNIEFDGGANSVTGAGTALTLQPADPSNSISIAQSLLGDGFDLTEAELAALSPGFSNIVIGRTDGSSFISVESFTSGVTEVGFSSPVTLRMPAGGIATGTAIRAPGGMVFDASSITLNADLVTAGGSVAFTGASFFGSNGTRIIDTTNGGAAAAGGNVNFAGLVSDNSDLIDVTIANGTGGRTTFNDDVLVGSLTVNGNASILGSSVSTYNGPQTYSSQLLLGPSVTLSTSGGSVVQFDGNVLSSGTPSDLTVNVAGSTIIASGSLGDAGSGALGDVTLNATFGSALNGAVNAASFTSTGPTALNGGGVATTGAQTYNGSVIQGADTAITANTLALTGAGSTWNASGNDLTLTVAGGATISAAFQNIDNLASAGAGATTVTGNLATLGNQTYTNGALRLTGPTTLSSSGGGNLNLLSGGAGVSGPVALTLNTAGATTLAGTFDLASLGTDAAGSTAINATAITTSGAQSFRDTVTLGNNATLTSTGGGAIAFDRSINGAQALTLDTSGDTMLSGAVGDTTPLASFTTAGGGTTQLNGGSVRTTGAQTFNSAVSLGSTTTTVTSSGAGNVTFASTINGPSALTVDTAGATTFAGAVGSSTALTSLTTGANGATVLAGSAVTTSGAQTYGNAVTVNAAGGTTSVTGSNVSFASTVRGASDGVGNLNITSSGGTVFSSAIGDASARLASLAVSGAGGASINGGGVATTGAQTYNTNVTQGANTTIQAGSLTVAGTSWDAAGRDLTLTVGAGVSVPGVFANINNFASTGAGATTVAGTLTTAGSQSYSNGAVVVNAASTLASSGNAELALNGAVTGSGDLALNTAGLTRLAGTINLGSLTTDAGGSTVITTNAVTTSGAQNYGDTVNLGASTTLSSTGNGALLLAAPVDGAQSLTLSTGGTATLAAAVGANTSLASLTTSAGGTTAINGSTVRTTGNQSYGNAVSLGANTTLTVSSGAGNVSFNGAVNSATSTARDLTINSAGNITLDAAAGATNALGTLALTSGGDTALRSVQAASLNTTTTGGVTQLSGTIATTGTQNYGGGVRVSADIATNAANSDIQFAGPVNSAAGQANDLTVSAGAGDVNFDQAVGAATGGELGNFAVSGYDVVLHDVTTSGAQNFNASHLLFLNSTYNSNGGDIALNGGSNAPVGEQQTTIWKSTADDGSGNANLTFNLGGGTFSTADTASVLVSDGSFTINGASAAKVGDVVAAKEFTVLAPSGQIILTGTLYVAGSISFGGATALAQAPPGETIVFKTPTGTINGSVTSSNPVVFQLLDPGLLDPSLQFILGSLLNAGLTLDDILSNPSFLRFPDETNLRSISKADIAKFLAGSVPTQEVDVAPETSISQAQREQMVQLGIYARPATSEEDRKRLFSHGVYRQLIADDSAPPDEFTVADVRLSAAAVQAALDQYEAIFTTGSNAGARSSRAPELQQLLSDAYARFAADSPNGAPTDFRAYLERERGEAGNAQALALINQLGQLFRAIERLGLTAKETEISKTKVLQDIRVPGLPLRTLRSIVDERA